MSLEGKLTKDHNLEHHIKYGRPILEGRVSKVNWTRCYPQTQQSINAEASQQTLFNITRSGYLAPASITEAYLEFDLTVPVPTSDAQSVYVEPYGMIDRVDQLWNDISSNSSNIRRDVMATQQIHESSLGQLNNVGIMAGVPFLPEVYPPLGTTGQATSPVHPGRNIYKFASSATASITKRFCVPIKYWVDTLLSDKDGLVNLQYMSGIQLFFYIQDPSRWYWNSLGTAASALPSPMVISNQILHLPIVFLDDGDDAVTRQLLDSEIGLTYATHACYINPQSFPSPLGTGTTMVNGTPGQQTITFSSLPPSVRSCTTFLEANGPSTSAKCGYKILTKPRGGVVSYQYLFDGDAVPGLPIRCSATPDPTLPSTLFSTPTDTDGYRVFTESSYARKMAMSDYRNMDGTLVDYYMYHNSAYPSSKSTASPVDLSNVLSSCFSMPITLAPMNPLLYGGSKFLTYQLQVNYSGNAGVFDGDGNGSLESIMTNFQAISVAWINRIMNVTRSGAKVLV